MNKIKTIYDAVKKMKEKDTIKGTLKVEGLKNEDKVFELNNIFEKNSQGCQAKGKTLVEIDNDGKKIKLESNIDFCKEGSFGHNEHMRHMHPFHGHHMEHGGGFKEGLSRITTVLGILSSIKLDEKEDGAATLMLESAEIPADIKSSVCEMMKKGREQHKHMHMEAAMHHHMFMKEFHEIEDADFVIVVTINKNKEIEKIAIDVKGKKVDEKNGASDMKLAAELVLEW